MANPQPDKVTRLANEILDALCRFRMPGEVRQIVDTVIRKTYGWNKTWDRIANSQFIEMTGQSKGNVSRSLKTAIDHRIVIKNDNNEYAFQKDYDQWLPFKKLSKLITKEKKVIKTATKVIRSDNKKLSEVRDTKDSKDTIQKTVNTNVLVAKPQDKRNLELQELIDYADNLGFILQGTKQINRFSAYNLWKKFGLDKSKRLVMAAINARGKPYAPTINDFVQLYRKVGDLITYYQKLEVENDKHKSIIG
jgi:phage replication O-like protein O